VLGLCANACDHVGARAYAQSTHPHVSTVPPNAINAKSNACAISCTDGQSGSRIDEIVVAMASRARTPSRTHHHTTTTNRRKPVFKVPAYIVVLANVDSFVIAANAAVVLMYV
jgi:hypothetical protein